MFTFGTFVVLRINSLFVFGITITEYIERRNCITLLYFSHSNGFQCLSITGKIDLFKIVYKILESDTINVPKSNSDILRRKQEPSLQICIRKRLFPGPNQTQITQYLLNRMLILCHYVFYVLRVNFVRKSSIGRFDVEHCECYRYTIWGICASRNVHLWVWPTGP